LKVNKENVDLMPKAETKLNRLLSLDALRGFDMLWIIGGEEVLRNLAKASDNGFMKMLAGQMEHVPWEGFHFYDLIMPLFLFMVGMSIPFSTGKRLELGDSYRKIYSHAIKRSVILFLLGMVCQCNLLALKIDGLFIIHDTLQAIAIGYLFSIFIYTRLNLKNQLLLSIGLVFLYWIILTFVPVPGQAAGILEPKSNIAKYVEQMVFGRFDDAPSPYTWFLGSMGFVATVMSGVFAGTIIRENYKLSFLKSANMQIHKTVFLVCVGLVLLITSLILNQWFVVIKPIWNPTFVLLTSGISFLLMAVFYFIIDVKGYHRWAFWLKVIGMNSIAVYMGVHLINFQQIAQKIVFGLEQYIGVWYPFIRSLMALAIIYGILYWMYKKKTFIKV
jgi:predicted acyltransferase